MEEEKEIFGRMALGLTAMYGVYRVFQFAIRRQMAEPSLGLQMLLAFVLYGVGFFLLLRIAGPKAVKGRVQAARMRPDAFVRILLLQMFSMVIHLLLIQFETLVLHSTSPAPPISFDYPWSFFMLLFLTPLFEELAFRIIPGDRLLPEQKNFYVLASALLFGLAHWPTAGWKTVIVTFYLGLIWANVYAQTRSLPIVVVLHILYNLLSGGITTLLGGISPVVQILYIFALLFLSIIGVLLTVRQWRKRRMSFSLPQKKSWRIIFQTKGFWLYIAMLVLSRFLLER